MYTGGRDRTDTPIKERILSPAPANSATPAQYINKNFPMEANNGAEDRFTLISHSGRNVF